MLNVFVFEMADPDFVHVWVVIDTDWVRASMQIEDRLKQNRNYRQTLFTDSEEVYQQTNYGVDVYLLSATIPTTETEPRIVYTN